MRWNFALCSQSRQAETGCPLKLSSFGVSYLWLLSQILLYPRRRFSGWHKLGLVLVGCVCVNELKLVLFGWLWSHRV